MEGIKTSVNKYSKKVKPGNVINYCLFKDFLRDSKGKIDGVVLHDKINKKEISINAKIIINATGIFADKIREKANSNLQKRMVYS